jgi:hypothetical protein
VPTLNKKEREKEADMDETRQSLHERLRDNIWAKFAKRRLAIQQLYASLANRGFTVRVRLGRFIERNQGKALVIVLVLIAAATFQLHDYAQKVIGPHFENSERLTDLRSWLFQLGAALIGAVAIVASLVLFAMQVNIERMPHGLFRRLSSDARLMGTFAGAFVLAMAVGCMGFAVNANGVGYVVVSAIYASGLVLLLFLLAYRRALTLVNPLRQLELLVAAAAYDLGKWNKRANRSRPLLVDTSAERSRNDSQQDMAKVLFFRANPGWTSEAEQQVKHAGSFARRYSEVGDYEVSRAALGAIAAINREYVAAKGRTFFSHPGIFDNPLATDAFINETLELVRQHVKAGAKRGDEEQVEQGLQTFASLVSVYLSIGYSSEDDSKTHAKLAAGYLGEATTSVLPLDVPDVLMEGIRQIQECAVRMIALADPDDAIQLSERVSAIGAASAIRTTLHPVVALCAQTLSDLTFALIAYRKGRETRFALKQLIEQMQFVAKSFLKVPDTPYMSTHGSYLGAYYSLTTRNSLAERLTQVVNAISDAKTGDKDAVKVLRNLQHWSENLHQSVKDLFVEAISVRSFFSHHLMQWIPHVAKVLLVASKAEICPDHIRTKLEKDALWLISQLSWVPDDEKAIAYVEAFQLTEVFFEAALDARGRGFVHFSIEVEKLLLSWTFKAGKRERGWGTFERGLRGAAVLAVMAGETQEAALVERIQKLLGSEQAPPNDIRARVAGELLERSEEGVHDADGHFAIDRSMAAVDPAKFGALLSKIAIVVAPRE